MKRILQTSICACWLFFAACQNNDNRNAEATDKPTSSEAQHLNSEADTTTNEHNGFNDPRDQRLPNQSAGDTTARNTTGGAR